MTVYIVFLRGWEDNHLEAVYASREEAQEHANKLSEDHEKYGLYGVVEEKTVIGQWQLIAQETLDRLGKTKGKKNETHEK